MEGGGERRGCIWRLSKISREKSNSLEVRWSGPITCLTDLGKWCLGLGLLNCKMEMIKSGQPASPGCCGDPEQDNFGKWQTFVKCKIYLFVLMIIRIKCLHRYHLRLLTERYKNGLPPWSSITLPAKLWKWNYFLDLSKLDHAQTAGSSKSWGYPRQWD